MRDDVVSLKYVILFLADSQLRTPVRNNFGRTRYIFETGRGSPNQLDTILAVFSLSESMKVHT